MKKLGIGKSRAYERIDEAVRSTSLPRHDAALLVARDASVNFSRFAAESDLALMRGANLPQATGQTSATVTSPKQGERRRKAGSSRSKTRGGNQVFVVHGRNERIRRALFDFLRSLGILPIEWNKALTMTGKGSPYVGQVLDSVFGKAKVIVVLFTPDDEAKLKAEFIKANDPAFERKLTGQPRPNVLFEAGMSFGRQPDTTVLVQVGKVRDFSDVAGRHVVHLTNSTSSRLQLIAKLKATGLSVDTVGEDWVNAGDFTLA